MAEESRLVKKSFYDSTKISEGELMDLIASMESMRQYDASLNNVTRLPSYDTRSLTLSTAIDIAKQIGLEDYAQKAIDSRYIPNKVQIQDLKKFGAKPNLANITEIYVWALKSSFVGFPGDNISINKKIESRDSSTSISVARFIDYIGKNLFGKNIKKIREEGLARLFFMIKDFDDINSGGVRINLYNPIVLRACENVLGELDRSFPTWKQDIIFEYPVDMDSG